ncbi:hypothetical protein PsorP6_002111 [Peronosclerospora sorghi]|uniref:Uncharacterized protein n=1 Tax=Peronosclerospora sorghi TaxID=230839 RepID=A0ACC0WX77_9STRA|nr:hypothetical protein PsorP6_002111 [Peronosclerospora sorghi]
MSAWFEAHRHTHMYGINALSYVATFGSAFTFDNNADNLGKLLRLKSGDASFSLFSTTSRNCRSTNKILSPVMYLSATIFSSAAKFLGIVSSKKTFIFCAFSASSFVLYTISPTGLSKSIRQYENMSAFSASNASLGKLGSVTNDGHALSVHNAIYFEDGHLSEWERGLQSRKIGVPDAVVRESDTTIREDQTCKLRAAFAIEVCELELRLSHRSQVA